MRLGLKHLIGAVLRFHSDRRGAVSPLMTLMLVPLIGGLGIAVEASHMLTIQRSIQNVADSAALAAAGNGTSTYGLDALAVSDKAGLVAGVDDTTILAEDNVTCPAPSSLTNCYRVTITRKMPVYLVRVLGFSGDTTTAAGIRAQTIRAVSIASAKGPGAAYCITALSPSATAINIKGAPDLDLKDCSLFSNGGAECTGQSGSTINYADVILTGSGNKPCGTVRAVTSPFSDATYSALRTQITPASTACSSYPQADKKTSVVAVANQLSGNLSGPSVNRCGDVQLTGNVSVISDTVLTIYNGRLDLNGRTLTATNGAHLTIIFSGDAASNSSHFPMTTTGSGTMDFSAPSSGTWSGVAIYQDPILTRNIDFIYKGSSPAFNITGLIYTPHANLQFSGAINHATQGLACLVFITYTFQINGSGSIFANPTRECNRAGLIVPGVPGTNSRQSLVQ